MRAVVLSEFGPPGNRRSQEVPNPIPGEGHIRIAVEAAGPHLIDATIRRGDASGPWPLPRLPAITRMVRPRAR